MRPREALCFTLLEVGSYMVPNAAYCTLGVKRQKIVSGQKLMKPTTDHEGREGHLLGLLV